MKTNVKIVLLLCLLPFFAEAMKKNEIENSNQYSKHKRIAVLICNKFASVPTSTDNDGLKPAFEKVGLLYEPIIWDNPDIDWKEYDAVLVRATWDYIEKYEQFIKVLNKIAELKIPLFNSLETIKWNSAKIYLLKLAQKGIHIFDTLMIKRSETPELKNCLSSLHADQYVIKPAISGGAHRTFATDENGIQKLYETEYTMEEDVIIQPLAQEIKTEGEWELIFFNGQFSHAILATPKAGDFRVQRMHGGTVKAVKPPDTMILEAQKILNLVPDGIPLYARVDFVRRGQQYYLMELEVIEPSLYLKFNEKACDRFTQALQGKIQLK